MLSYEISGRDCENREFIVAKSLINDATWETPNNSIKKSKRENSSDGTIRLKNGYVLLPEGQTRSLGEFELLEQQLMQQTNDGTSDNKKRKLRSSH